MNSSLQAAVQTFIEKEKLPEDYAETVELWFMPLALQLLQVISTSHKVPLIGISGCQGSGKSTLASLLVILLRELMGIKCINLSLDDFYLSFAKRQDLSKSVHPLFATRGVPGTHDVDLAISTIQALGKKGEVAIPRFNKALDDRVSKEQWSVIQAPVDAIIFEGWCLNIVEQDESELIEAINSLEKNEDPEGLWRQFANLQIKENYSSLYDLVDYLIMLKAPSFEKVFEWRQKQEDKLAGQQESLSESRVMNQAELQRFIQHYERITRHGMKTLPGHADVVFELSDEQTIQRKVQ